MGLAFSFAAEGRKRSCVCPAFATCRPWQSSPFQNWIMIHCLKNMTIINTSAPPARVPGFGTRKQNARWLLAHRQMHMKTFEMRKAAIFFKRNLQRQELVVSGAKMPLIPRPCWHPPRKYSQYKAKSAVNKKG